MNVKLGGKVKDKISGFTGVIISEHRYLNGCVRFSIQPSIDKDGELPKIETFDKPQLELIASDVVESEPEHNRTGGCDKYQDSGR